MIGSLTHSTCNIQFINSVQYALVHEERKYCATSIQMKFLYALRRRKKKLLSFLSIRKICPSKNKEKIVLLKYSEEVFLMRRKKKLLSFQFNFQRKKENIALLVYSEEVFLALFGEERKKLLSFLSSRRRAVKKGPDTQAINRGEV